MATLNDIETKIQSIIAILKSQIVKTITGILPLTFNTNTAGVASDWEIEGNDEAGKNLLQITTGTTTDHGVTFTSNAETGVVVANGTATGYDVQYQIFVTLPAGRYLENGCARGGGDNSYDVYMWDSEVGARTKKWDGTTSTPTDYGRDTSQEVLLTETKQIRYSIRIRNGYNAQNVVFKPMLRLPDTSATFEPYQIGVGQRTRNLFDKTNCGLVQVDAHGTTRFGSKLYGVENGEYTLACDNQSDRALYLHTITNGEYTTVNITSLLPYTFTVQDIDVLIIRTTTTQETDWDTLGVYNIMLVKGSTAPASFIPYGYELPITVNSTPQTFYIGNAPLTAGQSISKTSTGVDIELIEGENTVSTTLYNKPEMTIKYKLYGGN